MRLLNWKGGENMLRFLSMLKKEGSFDVVEMKNARMQVVGMDCTACSACDCACFCAD